MTENASAPGKALERQVADAYRRMGARKVEHDIELTGNQIDVYVEIEAAGRMLHKIAVEVKDWQKPVGIDVINKFAAVVDLLRNQRSRIDEGVIVSSSGFSRPARNAADEYGIRLLEPADLEAMAAGQLEKAGATVTAPVQLLDDDLEFANREVELRSILRPLDNPGAPRYVQVHAPSGMGKTFLLQRARRAYEAAGWICSWLDFGPKKGKARPKPATVLKYLCRQYGAEVGGAYSCAALTQQVMRAKQQSVVFLDDVELAEAEVRRWIKSVLIPALEEKIPDPKLRPCFIAAARHVIREWQVYSRQRFECVPLTPFTDTVVDDLLRRYVERAGHSLPDTFFCAATDAVLAITKGHPACIKRVLREIQEKSFALSAGEIVEIDTFNRTVGALLDEDLLVEHVPDGSILEVFKSLCVMRGYTPSLLNRLAEDGLMPAWEHMGWKLVRALKGTSLIDEPNGTPLYLIQPLIRQLIALQMEYNDQDRFLALNRVALRICEEQIEGVDREGNALPNQLDDRTQVAFVTQALYHQATLLRSEKAGSDSAGQLRDKLQEYLTCRLDREDEPFWVGLLLRTLEQDLELTALIHTLAGDKGLEHVLRPLYDLEAESTGG